MLTTYNYVIVSPKHFLLKTKENKVRNRQDDDDDDVYIRSFHLNTSNDQSQTYLQNVRQILYRLIVGNLI